MKDFYEDVQGMDHDVGDCREEYARLYAACRAARAVARELMAAWDEEMRYRGGLPWIDRLDALAEEHPWLRGEEGSGV